MPDINALLALEQEALIVAARPGSRTIRASRLAVARNHGANVADTRYPHHDFTGHAIYNVAI